MKNEELNEYIYHYLTKDKTGSAIMLTAPWGTGKSYYIQNDLVPYLEKKEMKCVILSLYGMNDSCDISRALYFKDWTNRLLEFTKKKCKIHRTNWLLGWVTKCSWINRLFAWMKKKSGVGSVFASTMLNGVAGHFNVNFQCSDRSMRKLCKSIDFSNKLIVLEDLERTLIDIRELLGFVNSLTEHDRAKILLVANKEEILKFDAREKEENGVNDSSKETERYFQVKEKTISDTISFEGDMECAIENILKSFGNKYFNQMLENKGKMSIIAEIKGIMEKEDVKSNNLRSLIFGCQKTVGLFRYVDESWDPDFLRRLFHLVIEFALLFRKNENMIWNIADRNSKYSGLGVTEDFLSKVVPDYIKQHQVEKEKLDDAYNLFCKEKKKEEVLVQINIIRDYYVHTEEKVTKALNFLLNKLTQPGGISYKIYGAIACYLVCVHQVLRQNETIEECRKAMITNLEKADSKEAEDGARSFNGLPEPWQPEEEQRELTEWMKEMLVAAESHKQKFTFSYHPEDLIAFSKSVREKKDNYQLKHKFATLFDLDRLMECLEKSSPEQLQRFKGAIWAVYDFSNIKDFFEGDKESLIEMKKRVDALRESGSISDKIVLHQFLQISGNLQKIIDRL